MTARPDPPLEPLDTSEEVVTHAWKPLREIAKYSAVAIVMLVAFLMLRKKLKEMSWSDFVGGLNDIWTERPLWLLAAVLLTALNYLVLTGYDFIAVRYLKKQLSIRRIMIGAIAGYALSNVFGWIFGGTAVRYRLYTSWGFSFKEIVAFVSILSLTFWLGLFLLAGVAFVAFEVKLPPEVAENTILSPYVWGWLFLTAVAGYLVACAFWRQPIRWGTDEFRLPPMSLSIQQLLVSAADFALASLVLFVLLPPGLSTGNGWDFFSTVLVAYLAGMIVTVTLHVPGGFGILDLILLYMLLGPEPTGEPSPAWVGQKAAVVAALVLFRVIYYFLPARVAGMLLVWNEVEMRALVRPKIIKPAA